MLRPDLLIAERGRLKMDPLVGATMSYHMLIRGYLLYVPAKRFFKSYGKCVRRTLAGDIDSYQIAIQEYADAPEKRRHV